MNTAPENQRQRLLQVLNQQLIYELENTEKLRQKIKELEEKEWTNEQPPS